MNKFMVAREKGGPVPEDIQNNESGTEAAEVETVEQRLERLEQENAVLKNAVTEIVSMLYRRPEVLGNTYGKGVEGQINTATHKAELLELINPIAGDQKWVQQGYKNIEERLKFTPKWADRFPQGVQDRFKDVIEEAVKKEEAEDKAA
jgi:hypothetical protein